MNIPVSVTLLDLELKINLYYMIMFIAQIHLTNPQKQQHAILSFATFVLINIPPIQFILHFDLICLNVAHNKTYTLHIQLLFYCIRVFLYDFVAHSRNDVHAIQVPKQQWEGDQSKLAAWCLPYNLFPIHKR